MKYRAIIRDEKTGECTWFVYVESGFGTVYACRFGTMRHAQRVAETMNQEWRQEGRLYEPKLDD